MPSVIILTGGAFEKCFSQEGEALISGLSAFMKVAPERSSSLCYVRTQAMN